MKQNIFIALASWPDIAIQAHEKESQTLANEFNYEKPDILYCLPRLGDGMEPSCKLALFQTHKKLMQAQVLPSQIYQCTVSKDESHPELY